MTFEEYCYSVCDKFVAPTNDNDVWWFYSGEKFGMVVADLSDLNQLACVVEALIEKIGTLEAGNEDIWLLRGNLASDITHDKPIKQAFIDFIEATRTDQCLEDYKDD